MVDKEERKTEGQLPTANQVDLAFIDKSHSVLNATLSALFGSGAGWVTTGKVTLGLVIGAGTLIVWALVTGGTLIYLYHRRQQELRSAQFSGCPNTRRQVPSLAISKRKGKAIRKMLGAYREHAFALLAAQSQALEDRQVRGNIFLPNYRDTDGDCAYWLHIPSGYFHDNMTDQDELTLRLRPGQGATGLAFQSGKEKIAIATEDGWEGSSGNISLDQLDLIHNDLRWVISIPLKDPRNTEYILGVVNIDGIDIPFSREVLNQILVDLLPRAEGIATKVADLKPRVMVTICNKEEVQ